MPTDTFAIAGANDDSTAQREAATWAGVPTGAFANNPFGTTIVTVSKNNSFWVTNPLLRWDTSSIPDTAVFSAGNLLMYVDGKGDPNTVTYAADWYDYGGDPSVAADWEYNSTAADAIASFSPASLTTGIVNTIPLTGFSGVNTTGFTGIRIAPLDTVAPTGDNFIDFAAFEHATGQEPRLELTYTVPVVGGVANRYLTRHSRMTSW